MTSLFQLDYRDGAHPCASAGSVRDGEAVRLFTRNELMNGNETPKAPAPTYTMGYSDEFQKLLSRRNAAANAAHLLPRLEPGMRVLDFGCGPGTISMGLARAVEPGPLHGVDTEGSQIGMARAAATGGGHENAFFRIGDVTALPFEDDFFDVAHCHDVLLHVPETRAALAEVKRVLKRGGIIASREMIGEANFFAPVIGELDDAMGTFLKLLRANGAHPDMGKDLKRVFLDAGFVDIEATASFDVYATTDDTFFFHSFAGGWFFSPDTVKALTKHGLANREQIDDWRHKLDQWRDTPGAIAGIAQGEAIARKP